MHTLQTISNIGRSLAIAQHIRRELRDTRYIVRVTTSKSHGVIASATSKPAEQTCRSIHILLQELASLEVSPKELKLYLASAEKLPRASPLLGRAREAYLSLQQSTAVTAAETDAESLASLEAVEPPTIPQDVLRNLWKWKRSGGGGSDRTLRVSEAALIELHSLAPDQASDKVTSVLLDDLPMSEGDKEQLGQAIEQMAMAGIGSAVWGTLGFALLGLIIINFIRPGS